ncbi:MAG: ABC transporter permease [Ruminococcaceae bacterium]|nr:ABC transporter permease [Oscillospiraceae bacterium]
MKNNAILTIFKKELARFFKDRRTLIALLMPGLLIYAIYSLMGGAMSDAFMPDEDYKPIVYVAEAPEYLGDILTDALFDVNESKNIDAEKQQIVDGNADVLIIFPENFTENMLAYSPESGMPAPNIEIYYNSSSTNSAMGYQNVVAMLDAFESSMTNKFDINFPVSEDQTFDLATADDMTGMIFSMIMPMLLVMLLFSGCMAVAPESIAGEKERGTIATLLITPTKRSHIAIGKILALSLMALISGASSTLGVVLSLPKLMGGTMEIDGSVYGVTDYAMVALVILSTVLVLITVISIISAYAKTIKEAGTYVTPLMIASMLIGLSGMMGGAAQNPLLYLIPLFNSVQSMIGIFSFEGNLLHVLITVGANIAVTAVGVFVLTRMFNSEKIMFNK